MVVRRFRIRKINGLWWVHSKGYDQQFWQFLNYYHTFEEAREIVHEAATLYYRMSTRYANRN